MLVMIDRERFDDGRFNRHVREYFTEHEVRLADVEPTKEGVWGFLRRRLHVADLIRRAGRARLRRAFPEHLIRLLEDWSGEEGRCLERSRGPGRDTR